MFELCTVCSSPDVSQEPSYYFWQAKTWWVVRCRA